MVHEETPYLASHGRGGKGQSILRPMETGIDRSPTKRSDESYSKNKNCGKNRRPKGTVERGGGPFFR